ncbi:hypothetical protein LZ32DRAFT_91534 [Colletotrichum eremochloae]|nr:hypothetical protein LZ32DRAFT_91534 [Colletotrichum eremochloae]
MDGVTSASHLAGITPLQYPSEIRKLLLEAENRTISDGSANTSQLVPISEKGVTGYEIPWSDLKTIVIEEFMKWLKDKTAWQDKVHWLTKEVVLEPSLLSLPSGTTCVIIPRPFPDECVVSFRFEGQKPVCPKWNLPVAYLLEPGTKIAVREGKARFYVITFDTPSRP